MISNKKTNKASCKANSKLYKKKFFRPNIRTFGSIGKQQNTTGEKENTNKDGIYKYGTWSDRVGVIVNIVLAGFTIALFFITRYALNEAKVANNIANNNYLLARRAFDSTITSGKEASENAKKSFELQQKSVESQIETMQQSRQRFELENKPAIQIYGYTFIDFEPEKPIRFTYQVENVGNQRVTILNEKATFIIAPYPPKKIITHLNFDTLQSRLSNFVINKGEKADFDFSAQSIFPTINYNLLETNKEFFYLYGKITFLDEIGRSRNVYKFCIQFLTFNKSNNQTFNIIYRNNSKITK